MQQKWPGKHVLCCIRVVLLTQEAAARLRREVGVLQQQLNSEHDLMVEAQSILTTTQVLCFTTVLRFVFMVAFCCLQQFTLFPASTVTQQDVWYAHVQLACASSQANVNLDLLLCSCST